MSAMFNVSIGDRLKAAVNQLEATGTSLQARATANLNANAAVGGQASQQGQARQSTGTASNPAGRNGQADAGKSTANLTSTKSGSGADAGDAATAPDAVTSPKLSSPDPAASTSPRAAYSASAAHLADSALSGLTGLRKSFNFRGSQDGARPTAAQLAVGAGSGSNSTGAKELKDMQAASTSAGTSEKAPSRSASPAGFLSATSFGIGSDPSTAAQTPRQPRSPTPARGLSRLRSPAKLDISLPTPDPTDPSTYPLPPSPELGASTLSAPLTGYADPLGASPLVAPSDDAQTPVIALDEVSQGGAAEAAPVIGLGLLDTDRELQAAEAAVEAIEHGETPVDVPASVSDSGEAGKKLDAINKIIRELTPLEGGVDDPDAIEGWVRMMKGKVEMTNEELVRLRSQIAQSRIEELRDTHRLEGSSQSTLITKLRSQLSTAESNLAARVAELSSFAETKFQLGRAQTQIKEEEEKRTKAIQLLKTVRLKLVKAEKDKEEVEKDRAEERAERAKATDEVERVRAEKEREVQRLRAGFERELAGQKERWEREMKDKKGAWELEMITTKASHARELSNKTTMVAGLEDIVKELTKTKDDQFHTIQARQSEAETARSESETLQNRTKELEFQLREANERISILEDASTSSSRPVPRGRTNGFLDTDRHTASPSPSPAPSRRNSGSLPGPSPAEVQRIVAEAEARAEAKLNDMRNRVRSLEKERNDLEEEWGFKLQERVRELEGLKRRIHEKESEYDESLQRVKEVEGKVGEAAADKKKLEKEIQGLKDKAEEMAEDVATAQEAEKSAKEETAQIKLQLQSLTSQVDEQKNLVTNLRTANKTLREELRKVQSSVQLMEKQRNPGVGYWSAANQASSSASGVAANGTVSAGMGSRSHSMSGEGTPLSESSRKSIESSRTDRTGGTAGTAPASAGVKAQANDEEEVNLEYLRNVILQFLEHPHMRRQLVQVLSVILHFTPQEVRRLNSKLTA